jgi:hypothetical protein
MTWIMSASSEVHGAAPLERRKVVDGAPSPVALADQKRDFRIAIQVRHHRFQVGAGGVEEK